MPSIDLKSIVTEKELQSQVYHLAKLGHWDYYHTHNSLYSPAGFPDCVMVRGDRLIFAELKRENGKPSIEQTHWLQILATIPSIEVYLWKPQDWDEIVKVLK